MLILKSRSRHASASPSRGGWVQVGMAIVAGILSSIAAKMLAKKNDSPVKHDKPTTLSTRGSFMPWVLGIRDVGPVFAWAGRRKIIKEKVEGAGKGGSTPTQDVFHEAGWHILGVGPVTALHKITQAGTVIFNGPITSASHPSGTTVDLGTEGSFTIYWGEVDQPINTFLGDSNHVGISSRWPYTCYIVWFRKRLSSSPTWPVLTYTVERAPVNTELTQSTGFYDPGITLSGKVNNVEDVLASSDPDTGYLQFPGNKTKRLKPGREVEITGNGLADGTYSILRSTVAFLSLGFNPFTGLESFRVVTRMFLETGTLGADDQGTAEHYVNDDTDGVNIAHAMAEVLFAPFPQGLGLPTLRVEGWDLPSLEALGVEAETQEWRAGILGSEGETAEALLGNMLQDHGTLLPIDTSTGRMLFKRIREEGGVLPALSESVYSDTLPEIETNHGERPADRLIFGFSDRSQGFADETIGIDDDGQAAYLEHQRARKVGLTTVVLFDTAAALAELRSPEELADSGTVKLDASREARGLIPGDVITADGFDEPLRVIEVDMDTLSERVRVDVMPDFYGAPFTTFQPDPGGSLPPILDPEPDEIMAFVEVPDILSPGEMTVMMPHVRAHDQIVGTTISLSRDNLTYSVWGTESLVQTGGTLDAALEADGPSYQAQSVAYTELGPDNAALTQDLSADPTNFGLGRQLAVIVSDEGAEICFLQRAVIIGGGSRRLDGLSRARYGTRKLAHPIGSMVFIFDRDAITPIGDVLLEPAEDLHVKSAPFSTAGAVSEASVAPYSFPLYGKGLVPEAPGYVQTRAPYLNVPGYGTSDDVTVSWTLTTAASSGTGCGYQNAGTSIGAGVIAGTVFIEFLTTGDVVKASKTVTAQDTTSVTITTAEIIAAFGSETDFKVRATHIANGYLSDASPSLLIEKI